MMDTDNSCPKSLAIKITALSAGTPVLDGFSTATAAFLILLIPGLTPWEIGCFSCLYFAGFLVGSGIFGSISDRIGRRPVFTFLMGVFAIAAFAPLIKTGTGILFFTRAVTGLALGGDYPVSQAVVSETIPAVWRNRSLSVLMLGWYIGAIAGVLIAIPVVQGFLPWEFFFGVEGLVGLLLFLGRISVVLPNITDRRSVRKAIKNSPKKALQNFLKSHEIPNFAFCVVFWLCQTIPATVLMFYAPSLISVLTGNQDGLVQSLLLYVFVLIGVLPATTPFFAKRPKAVLIGTFGLMAVALILIAFLGSTHPAIASAFFILYALAYGLQTPLDFVFPNMLFKEESRGFWVGIITAVSRLGALVSALIFPILLNVYPAASLLMGGAAVLIFGLIYSLKNAPKDHLKNPS